MKLSHHAMSDDDADLWSKLDTLDDTEPLGMEDDLILRMQAVSKVKRKSSAAKGQPAKAPWTTATKSIKKKKKQQPKERMQV